MTNKLVVIIISLKVPKIKKILLYEMKFLVPNYSCLQNPWLGGYSPQIPILCVLRPQLNFLNPRKKFLGTPLALWGQHDDWHYSATNVDNFLQSLKYFTVFATTPQNITLELQLISFSLPLCRTHDPDQPPTSVTLLTVTLLTWLNASVTSQRGCI